MIDQKSKLNFDKVAVALASWDHQKSKLRAVAGAEGFWVAELRVRQLKIGSKSCFANYQVAENWQPNSKNFKHSNYKGLRDTQGVYPSFY